MKISLLIVLALLAGLVVLNLWSDKPAPASVPNTSQGPSFEARVVKPRLSRPLFGLIPETEPRFDHTSRGAKVVSVGHDHVELSADDWELFIETDGEERITSGTRLAFPIELGERHLRLRCRPADRAVGHLRTSMRAGSDKLDGSFIVELAACENADSGKAIEWPPAPLTLSGSFAGLTQRRR